jgi:hypothetical protein
MQKLNSLILPDILPNEEAIKSCGQNIHNYEPEFWEYFYVNYRYLKNITNEKLNERYKILSRNLHVLTSFERHIIPINSFLSSWYWYQKEHQTRYEFLLRGMPLPNSLPEPRKPIKKPFSPKGANSCDVIFRYGELKYMKLIVDEGIIRISPASEYKNGNASDPRTDDEINKHRWELGDKIKIITQGVKEHSIIGDMKRTSSTSNNYYTLCCSCDFEPTIFNEFNYDSCVVIRNPEEFAIRLEKAAKKQLPGWYFHHNPTEYFDPHVLTKNQHVSATMSKDFSYAYQMEYRFVWHPLNNGNAEEYIEVNIGSLKDICELYVFN